MDNQPFYPPEHVLHQVKSLISYIESPQTLEPGEISWLFCKQKVRSQHHEQVDLVAGQSISIVSMNCNSLR